MTYVIDKTVCKVNTTMVSMNPDKKHWQSQYGEVLCLIQIWKHMECFTRWGRDGRFLHSDTFNISSESSAHFFLFCLQICYVLCLSVGRGGGFTSIVPGPWETELSKWIVFVFASLPFNCKFWVFCMNSQILFFSGPKQPIWENINKMMWKLCINWIRGEG